MGETMTRRLNDTEKTLTKVVSCKSWTMQTAVQYGLKDQMFECKELCCRQSDSEKTGMFPMIRYLFMASRIREIVTGTIRILPNFRLSFCYIKPTLVEIVTSFLLPVPALFFLQSLTVDT